MYREIRISVRNLVEYVLRSGDIDNRFMSMSRAQEGTKAHQKVQKTYNKGDLKEVTLKEIINYQGLSFNIEGRADGVLFTEDGVVIDEIKSTSRDLKEIGEGLNIRHWAQGICYAYFYSLKNSIGEVSVQLTYFHIETEDVVRIKRTMTFVDVENFFYDLLDKYINWAGMTFSWSEIKNRSIRNLSFPFVNYRIGQRELAVAAYKTIKEGARLFVQAPTGIGKTISTLYPAIKVMGEEDIEKIFYLTAKTITREVPRYSLDILRESGMRVKSGVLTAKEKICLNDEVKCNPKDCIYAKGHYDRVNDGIIDIFTKEDAFNRDIVLDYSIKHKVCPFEFQLDLSLFSDVIICDYNYVFDPQVYLKRFFDLEKGDYAFLIDESHNLVDRSREMFSEEIRKSWIKNVKDIVKDKSKKLSKSLNSIIKVLNEQKNIYDIKKGYYQREEITELYFPIKRCMSLLEEYLMEHRDTNGYDNVLELYFKLNSFVKISDYYDDNYVTTIEEVSRDIVLKLYCVDASKMIRNHLNRGKSSIFFSATLTPIDYFMEVLGGSKEDYHMILKSPFPRENLGLMVKGNTSTRYKDREDTYDEIVEQIYSFFSIRKGNYMIFFPSYAYMERVYERFKDSYPGLNITIQNNSMDEYQREEFLSRFHLEYDLIAFAVMGGVFSEGIDLVGDSLIGAVIVGVGMPQICFDRDIIKEYFDHKTGEGFNYAYTFPGMNKVLQAVGRVIRTEEDKGAILLIDDRYSKGLYRKLMPKEWNGYKEVNNKIDIIEFLSDFWNE